MSNRLWVRSRVIAWHAALAGAMTAVMWLTSVTNAQAPSPGRPAVEAGRAGTAVPKRLDGRPDLEGVWSFSTATPLERPRELADKPTLTHQEAEQYAADEARKRDHDANPPADIVGNYNEFWYDGNKRVIETRRTSLVIDPPDGRVPPMTPDAQRRADALKVARKDTGPDEPTPGGWLDDLGPGSLRVRCIMGFNSGPPMTPAAYNQNVELLQSDGYVVILNEMVHNARIVPMDGRPFDGVAQWAGESRGRWEGDTLVVETRNFARETAFMNGSTTPSLHLTERFTRVDADTLMYEFTVNDPTVWTRPWTAQIPMAKNPEPMYEYACHEGNYGLTSILSGARAKERAAAGSRQ